MKKELIGTLLAIAAISPKAFAQEAPTPDYVIQNIVTKKGFNDCFGKVLDGEWPGTSFVIGYDPDAPVPDSKYGNTGICKISVIHRKNVSLSGKVFNVLWLQHSSTPNTRNQIFESTIASDVQAYRIP